MSENKQNNSSETYSSVFNLNDLPLEARNTSFNFFKYNHRDGEWIEKDEPVCIVRRGSYNSNDFLSATFRAPTSGVLECILEKDNLISDGTTLYKLHPKGYYIKENTPESFEYKEFFKDSSQDYFFKNWLVLDGEFVKVGEPIFEFKDFKRQEHINYSKKEGFIHRSEKLYSINKDDLLYIIRDTDEQRIEELFENHSNIILDEFTNSTIIKWWLVSSKFQISEGVITKSDDYITDFLFSFNYIHNNDFIIFHFNPKQIRPRQSDKVSFLFYNGEQIDFELNTNPIQSKNRSKQNILEYKCIITHSELQLFATSNFKKWKISLVSDKRDILGGNTSGGDFYHGEKNIQIVIKKFANDYINLVKSTIPDYQPINLKKNKDMSTPQESFCSVYLMHDTSNDFYKIGISNNPEYRESTLQSEKPTIDMIIAKKFPIRKIAESIEKALHDTYSEKRLRGEWFKLDLNDIKHIKETLR